MDSELRFATYNVLELYDGDSVEKISRWGRVHEVIRSLEADVLAVQEVMAPADGGEAALKRLAESTGMNAGPVARGHQIKPRDMYFWVGLLFSNRVLPDGGEREYGDEMWHNLVTTNITFAKVKVKIGSYHAPPFGRHRRADEAERVMSALTRPRPAIPSLVGGDWNELSADRIQQDDGTWNLFDSDDPYAGTWREEMVFQTTWHYNDRGERLWAADRAAGDVLWAGGLHDVRALLASDVGDAHALRAPTAGHWPADPFEPRAIDLVRANTAMRPAAAWVQTVDTPLARTASDHLPVVSGWNLDRLRG